MNQSDRGIAFERRCKLVGVSGVSLHCYRYAWAERGLKCGYPERFAQQALGHNSKAVHRAYAKYAEVRVPSLEDWEKQWKEKVAHAGKPKLVAVDFQAQPDGATAEATAGGALSKAG